MPFLIGNNADICGMEQTLNKTLNMSSFNITYDERIIAGADVYRQQGNETGFALEVAPYLDELEKAGITTTDEKRWDDFYDSEEDDNLLSPEERINTLLSTIVSGYAAVKEKIIIKKRKDVYDLRIAKNGMVRDLRMVCERDRFVNSDQSFQAALYVHDREEFDIWCFAVDADDAEVFRTVFPALKAVSKRLTH